MSDDVMTAFLRRTHEEELPRVLAASDVLHLSPDFMSGDPPRRFYGLFTDVERFTPGPGHTFQTLRRPLPFVVEYVGRCRRTRGQHLPARPRPRLP